MFWIKKNNNIQTPPEIHNWMCSKIKEQGESRESKISEAKNLVLQKGNEEERRLKVKLTFKINAGS